MGIQDEARQRLRASAAAFLTTAGVVAYLTAFTVELYTRGPMAAPTWVLLVGGIINFSLRWCKPKTTITAALLLSTIVMFVMEAMVGEEAGVGSMRVVQLSLPMAAVLLLNVWWGVLFFTGSVVVAIIFTIMRGEVALLVWLNLMAAIVNGAVMVAMASVFSYARGHAQRLSAERRRSMSKQLKTTQEASMARDQFTDHITEEIQIPVRLLKELSERLNLCPLSSEQQKMAKTVVISSGSLLASINNVIDLSRLELGLYEVVPDFIDIREATREVVDDLRDVATKKGLMLSCVIEPEVSKFVRIDSTAYRQVLSHLVRNGLKFTSKGKVLVTVSLREMNDIEVSVEDTGIGIEKQLVDKIHLPFVQGDSSSVRKYGGFGLGLTLAKEICERMGGRLRVESQVGEGSRFWFSIAIQTSASDRVAVA